MSRFICFIAFTLIMGTSAADTQRISISSQGDESIKETSSTSVGIPIGSLSGLNSISADGRYTVFSSPSSNLVKDDTNEEVDYFVHDRVTATTTRVNVASDGSQAVGGAKTNFYNMQFHDKASITDDGRYIVFPSAADNLALGGRGLYIHDRVDNTTSAINVPFDAGFEGMNASGRYIAITTATQRVVEDNNNHMDLYIFDRQAGRSEWIQFPEGILDDFNPNLERLYISQVSFSDNGRFVLYYTGIDPIFDDDIYADYYLYDRINGTHTRYDTDANAILSGNGQFVVTRQGTEVIIHDRYTAQTRKIYAPGTTSTISADGRYLVTSVSFNVIVHDLITGKHAWVTPPASADFHTDIPFVGYSISITNPAISADGNYIAFTSIYDDIIEGDTNETFDVFVAKNPLADQQNEPLIVEKLINYKDRISPLLYGRLLKGTQYRSEYRVTNNSADRLYNVNVFDNDQLACSFYVMEPGQTKRRCGSFQSQDEAGEFVNHVEVKSIVASTGEQRVASTRSYISAFSSLQPYQYSLRITYSVKNADGKWVSTVDANSPALISSSTAEVRFSIYNGSGIALHRVKTYHDAQSPINRGWIEQCNFGTLLPGQLRQCIRTVDFDAAGLNVANGIVRADNALSGTTYIVKRSDQLHVTVP